MLCPKCGHQLPADAKFCSGCGTGLDAHTANESTDIVNETDIMIQPEHTEETLPVDQPQPIQPGVVPAGIYADYQPPVNPPQPGKKKRKGLVLKIVALLVGVVVLLSGIAVLGYYTFLPAKQTLYAAQYATIWKSYRYVDHALKRYEDKHVKPMYEDSFNSKASITLSMDDATIDQFSMSDEDKEIARTMMDNLAVDVSVGTDLPNEKADLSAALKYQGNTALSAEAWLENKDFGLTLPELNDTFIAGKLEDLPRLLELYPGDGQLSQLGSLSSSNPWISKKIHDKVKIKHSDIKKLLYTYGLELVNNIPGDAMSISRGEKTDLFGEEIGCQEITVTLTASDMEKMLVSFINTMKDDETLYDVVIGNILEIYDIIVSENESLAQLTGDVDITKTLNKSSFKALLTMAKLGISEDMFPEEVTMKIYLQGFEIVKYDIDVPMPDGNLHVVLESKTSRNASDYRLSIIPKGEGVGDTRFELTISDDYDKSSDTEDLSVKADFNLDMPDNTGTISLNFTSDDTPRSKDKVEKAVEANLSVDLISNGAPTRSDITFTLNGDETRNNKGLPTHSEYTAGLKLDVYQFTEPVNIHVGIESDTSYGKEVKIPKTSGKQVLDLSTVTKEELDAWVAKINENLAKLETLFGGLE